MGSLRDYDTLLANPMVDYFQLSEKIGGPVHEQAVLVKKAFCAQREFLNNVTITPKPKDDDGIKAMLKSMSDAMQEIIEHRDKNRQSDYFIHLSAVSESITILGWVIVYPDPVTFAKDLLASGAYFGNKVITAFKDKGRPDAAWAKSWLSLLGELINIIKEHYRLSLNWNSDAHNAGVFVSPPPPPPPPVENFAALGISTNKESEARNALLRDINTGVDITKRLKRVDKSALPQKGSVASPASCSVTSKPASAVTRPPRFELDGRKWCVEYIMDRSDLIIQSGSMNQCAYVYQCHNCTIIVKDKVNCITLDSCSKLSIAFDDLVSSLEIINCKKVQAQSLGKMPTLVIDKSEGIMAYLSNKSLDVEVISSKSSELNLSVPDEAAGFIEHAVPEQLKTTVVQGRLHTVAIEKM